MQDIYGVLEEVKKNPVQYLGRTSVISLKGFINGYFLAKRDMGIPLTEREDDFQKFQEWMNYKFSHYCIKETGWDKILILTSVDENKAIDYFFYQLEAFKTRQKSEVLDDPVDGG
jgi:hypothetical protein